MSKSRMTRNFAFSTKRNGVSRLQVSQTHTSGKSQATCCVDARCAFTVMPSPLVQFCGHHPLAVSRAPASPAHVDGLNPSTHGVVHGEGLAFATSNLLRYFSWH